MTKTPSGEWKASYEGTFREHKRDGFGIETDSGQKFYAGEWKADEHHGRGRISFPNAGGDFTFTGTFQHSKKIGFGIAVLTGSAQQKRSVQLWTKDGPSSKKNQEWEYGVTDKDGRAYRIGMWKGQRGGDKNDDGHHAQGLFEGLWNAEGRLDLWGKLVYEDGTVYEGGFKDGVFDGEGTLFVPREPRYRDGGEGEWGMTVVVEGSCTVFRGVWEGGEKKEVEEEMWPVRDDHER